MSSLDEGWIPSRAGKLPKIQMASLTNLDASVPLDPVMSVIVRLCRLFCVSRCVIPTGTNKVSGMESISMGFTPCASLSLNFIQIDRNDGNSKKLWLIFRKTV